MEPLSAYWDDVAKDMEDPEYLREYITESVRVRAIDDIVNSLTTALETLRLSKADVARAIQTRPEVVRRLLTAATPNPTIGTISEVAAALGLELTLRPMSSTDRRLITEPLLSGHARNPKLVAQKLARSA